MSWLKRLLTQTVTYWAPNIEDAYGEETFVTPTSITRARWEDHVDHFLDRYGKESISKARVFLTQSVEEGGYLYLGTSTEANPRNVSGADRIQRIIQAPSIRNNQILYEVIL